MYMNFKQYLSDMLGQLVALYIHPRATDRFLAGVVTDLTENGIQLALRDPDETPDGGCICFSDAVYRVETASCYLRQLPAMEVPADIPSISAFFPWAERQNTLLQILDRDGKFLLFGTVQSCTERGLRLRRVRQDGADGARVSLSWHRIGAVFFGGTSERQLTALRKGT